MSAHSTQPAAPNDPGQPAAPAHPHRQALDDLITMGTDLARALHRQALIQAEAAQAAVPPQPTPHAPYEPPATTLVTLTTAFDRIARAVRRCIALAQLLARPLAPARDPAQHRAAARKQVIRAVEDTIHRAANEGDRAESLTIELRERLDAPDFDWDLANRPIPDIIAELCRDLGLAAAPGTNPWRRRTPADIRDLCARAAAPTRTPAPRRPGRPGAANPAQPRAANPKPRRHSALAPSPGRKPSAAHRTSPRPSRRQPAAWPGKHHRPHPALHRSTPSMGPAP